jgi:hypothetical protein
MVSEAPNSDEFYRENFTVGIEYSSGECRDAVNIGNSTFLGSDVWNVGVGKVVKIEIEPKASFLLAELVANSTISISIRLSEWQYRLLETRFSRLNCFRENKTVDSFAITIRYASITTVINGASDVGQS